MKSAKRTVKKGVAGESESVNRFSIHDFPAPAILYTKKNPVIVEWNSAACKLLGYQPGERPYLKVIRPRGMHARRNVSKSKVGVSMGIVPHTTKNGDEKLIEVINKQVIIKEKEYCLEWLVDQTALVQSQLSQLHFYDAVTRASIVSRADLGGHITYVNSNFIKISGYVQKELLGKNHHIINSGYHPKSFWTTMWKTIASGKTWRADVKNKAKDGSYYWVDTFIMPFMDENGKVREFLSIRNDITLRKESEEALAQSNSSLRETLIFGKMGSAELDLQTFQFTVNRELFQLLELADPHPKTMPLKLFLKKYVQPDFRSLITTTIQEEFHHLGEERKVVELEFEMITVTGKKIWIEAQYIFKGNRALGILHDVTEKRKTNKELLLKSETIDKMLNSITDGFFATDRELNFTLVSPVFARLAKMQPEEIQGRNMLALFPYMKNEELTKAYREAIQTQRSSTLEYSSSQSHQVFQISVYPSPEGLFIYYKDVSLSKIAEAELRDTSELFRRLSDNVPGMIYNFYFTSEEEGGFPFVSSGSQLLFGIPASEVMKDSRRLFQMVHPDDYPSLVQTLKHAFHSRKRWSAEFRVTMPDGTLKWIAGESNSYLEKDGKHFWYGFLYDVSRQKKGQVELKKVYDELNAILNTSTDATFFLDSQYRIRVYNKTGEEQVKMITGRQVQQGDSLLEYVPKETMDGFKKNFRKALDGEPVIVEHEAKVSETSSMWVHLRYLPVRSDDQKVIGVSVNATDITSRKQAEQELFKSRTYFELMVNSQSSYLIRTDMEGKYTFVNAKFSDRFGTTGQELLGTHSLDTILEEDHELCRQTVNDCFARPGKVVTVTLRKSKKHGGYYWTEWEFVALQDERGGLIGIQAVGLDATERVIAIKEMQENGERFRTLISDISIGILLQGPRSEIYLTNQAALDLLGLTEDQLLGRTSYSTAWNVIHEDGSDFINKDMPVPLAIDTKLPVRGVVMGVYRPKKNDRVWLLVDAIPRLDEQGNISNVICTFNNITELKAAESSLQFTRFTINHTSDAVFWIRPDASVADMNPAAHTSLGYTAEEMLKMSLADIDVGYTDYKWHQFWKLVKEKKTITSVTRLRKKDGTEVDVEINSNFIIFRDKEFNCVFIRDITERKKSEVALINSNQEKDMLIKEIHHRVKNNLQLISSILYIKMSRMQQSEIKDFLEDTRQKIRSIALIHERLLQTNSVNQVDISDYLGKLIADLEMSNTRHELRIYIEHNIEPEEMNLDTAIYCGLIINELVTNSIKHAFVGRMAGNIAVLLRKMGDIHQLVVVDDGISMPEEVVVGQTGSFGMQMLEIFIKQLKGKVEINRQNGTSFSVHF